jgi:hypothetical protein
MHTSHPAVVPLPPTPSFTPCVAPGGRPAHPAVSVFEQLALHVGDAATRAGEMEALLARIAENSITFRNHEGGVRILQQAFSAAVAIAPRCPSLVCAAATALRAVCTAHEENKAEVSPATVDELLALVSQAEPAEVARCVARVYLLF